MGDKISNDISPERRQQVHSQTAMHTPEWVSAKVVQTAVKLKFFNFYHFLALLDSVSRGYEIAFRLSVCLWHR